MSTFLPSMRRERSQVPFGTRSVNSRRICSVSPDTDASSRSTAIRSWASSSSERVSSYRSAAGVFLQGLLKPLTQRPEIRVTSIRSLPPVRKGEYAEVAVQMEIQTSTEGLALLLADLSRQTKILRVLKLTASTGAYNTGQVPRKEVVAVSMVVAGLSAAPLDEKAPGRGDE